MNCLIQGQGCDAENTVSEAFTITPSEIKGPLPQYDILKFYT